MTNLCMLVCTLSRIDRCTVSDHSAESMLVDEVVPFVAGSSQDVAVLPCSVLCFVHLGTFTLAFSCALCCLAVIGASLSQGACTTLVLLMCCAWLPGWPRGHYGITWIRGSFVIQTRTDPSHNSLLMNALYGYKLHAWGKIAACKEM